MQWFKLADAEIDALEASIVEACEFAAMARIDDDPVEVGYWSEAEKVRACFADVTDNDFEIGEFTLHEGVRIGFTDEALSWLMGEWRSEKSGGTDRARGTCELTSMDVLTAFALDTIAGQLSGRATTTGEISHA